MYEVWEECLNSTPPMPNTESGINYVEDRSLSKFQIRYFNPFFPKLYLNKLYTMYSHQYLP